jgi:hypothetical protein
VLRVAEAVLPALVVSAKVGRVLKVLDAAVLVGVADRARVGRVAVGGKDGPRVFGGVGLGGAAARAKEDAAGARDWSAVGQDFLLALLNGNRLVVV